MLPSKSVMLQRQVQDLEQENADLKIQLMQAHAMIDSLKQENQALSKRLTNYKGSSILSGDSTFVTNKGTSSLCENCNQEVPHDNLDLHLVQCLRRITRCKVCNEPLVSSELEKHVQEHIGTIEDMSRDIEAANIQGIESRFAHGARIEMVSEDANANTLLHLAVKTGKREIVQYFLNKGIDVNTRNGFGETALHLVCGKFKDICMVQFLASKGGDYRIMNSLGDSCMEVARRGGFHDAVIHFQQRSLGSGRPNTSAGGNRIQGKMRSPNNEPKFDL